MNRTQAKEWEGKEVKLDWWDFNKSYTLSGGTIINPKEVIGSIWILNKLTKGGLCMISRHGSKESISISPGCLSQWEYNGKS